MKWQVALIGNADDLEDLSEIFCSPDLRISKKDKGFILESCFFEELNDTKKIKAKTDTILLAINATRCLIHGQGTLIKNGGIIIDDEFGKRTVFLEATVLVTPRIQGILSGTSEEKIKSPITKWIPLVESDERVKRVFDLVNHDFNSYISFYKIIEVVQEDSYAPVMRQGEFYSEIDRFKHTAESYDAIGKDARHAHKKFIKPETPMTVDQARNLVSKILQMWLNSKIG